MPTAVRSVAPSGSSAATDRTVRPSSVGRSASTGRNGQRSAARYAERATGSIGSGAPPSGFTLRESLRGVVLEQRLTFRRRLDAVRGGHLVARVLGVEEAIHLEVLDQVREEIGRIDVQALEERELVEV